MRLLAILLITLFAASAAAEDDYETLFAAGMQKYAEGVHEDALSYLYRAYAHKPNPMALSLIIRTHDFMGHCTAADRQRDVLRTMFADAKVPTAQMCVNPGKIQISCTKRGMVLVNGSIEVRCGQTVEVPKGEHFIVSTRESGIPVRVASGKTTRVDIVSPIEKLPLDDQMQLKKVESEVAEQLRPRFKIWVRTSLRDDPDLNVPGELPGFQIYQDKDGLFHVFSDSLKPVQSKRSRFGTGGSSND